MKIFSTKILLDELAEENLIQKNTATEALQHHVKQKASISTFLLDTNEISSSQLSAFFARKNELPLFDVQTFDEKALLPDFLDNDLLHKYQWLPIRYNAHTVLIVLSDSTTLNSLKEITKNIDINIKVAVADYYHLKKHLERYLKARTSANRILPNDESNSSTRSGLNTPEQASGTIQLNNNTSEATTDTSDFPVVRFIDKIILDAISKNASDIHFEPFEKNYRIRARIDGVLYTIDEQDKALAPRLTSRLKVMANLDISEKRVPQDGRISIKTDNNRQLSLRVNTCPTVFGEKIVLRILDPTLAQVGVDSLGFEPEQKELFIDAINKKQGMVLVTGPTGSGKTVTLYTALNILNDNRKNISTVEDPVEIFLPGVNQVNINPKANLHFSSVLRAFLRQDPDIIMVGEIRDRETSEIAIKASQTGHLVLSTLHTNSAAETLTRLENMGIPGFNIATSISLVIAQRLIRKLCDNCKKESNLDHDLLISQGFNKDELDSLVVYEAVGCEECTSGYKGRIGIFEALKISPAISKAIMAKGTSLDIFNIALKENFLVLRQAGLNKIREGIASLAEINRVTE